MKLKSGLFRDEARLAGLIHQGSKQEEYRARALGKTALSRMTD